MDITCDDMVHQWTVNRHCGIMKLTSELRMIGYAYVLAMGVSRLAYVFIKDPIVLTLIVIPSCLGILKLNEMLAMKHI